MTVLNKVSCLGLALGALGLACRGESNLAARGEPAKGPHQPTRMDSAVPREVALARFQQASGRPTKLEGGAPNRDALVREFLRAVEARDTSALRRLVLSRGEFAWLYYPTSAQGLPPYSLSPELYWFMTVEQSNRGARALLTELGGRRVRYAGYRCEGDSTVEAENTLWGPCLIRSIQRGGDTLSQRLFGPIVGRGGRYKFLSYSNKL
jgi:hypothetical protein